jgi:next-to-BRCA1 protein 1
MLMTRRINVVESDSHHFSDDSMASSSIIMPISSPSALQSEHVPSTTVRSVSAVSTIVTDDDISEIGSDSSSVSLISMPSSPEDDEDDALFHDSRSQTTADRAAAAGTTSGMDFVMLYDDSSSSEE